VLLFYCKLLLSFISEFVQPICMYFSDYCYKKKA
jgi:hypothetical protein